MRELSSISIDSLRFADIVQFCANQYPENLCLEYKSSFSAKNVSKQIKKEVASFANTHGGTIIYGVGEVGNRKPDANPLGVNLGGNPRQTVQSTCVHEIFPPVSPEVSEFIPNPDDHSLGFLVVRVPASDHLHTVDSGAGIYVRASDQSEPVRASVDMIEHLINRRSRAADLQESRRAKALERLKLAGNHVDPGSFCLTIGPRFSFEPLFTGISELRNCVSEISVQSYYFSSLSPVDPNDIIRGILDGVYSVQRCGNFAGSLDIFGNVSLIANLLQPWNLESFLIRQPGDYASRIRATAPKNGTEIESINVSQVGDRIISAIRTMRNICAKTGFVGLLGGRLSVFTRDVPLVIDLTRWVAIIGTSPFDDRIDFDIEIVSSDISDDEHIMQNVQPILERLIWAWGPSTGDFKQEQVDLIMTRSERTHFGSKPCQKCKREIPNNRKKCPSCTRVETP